MNKAMVVVAVLAAAVGCKSIKFERIERTPVEGATNVVAMTERIVRGTYYAYGLENNLEGLEVTSSPSNGVSVKINRVTYDMSKEHAKLVDASLSGVASVVAKVGAAIATAGGSAGADAIAGLVNEFVKKGGDVSKAAVECKDGSCSLTDGVVCVGMACRE